MKDRSNPARFLSSGPGPQSWMKAPAPQPAAPVALGTCSGCSTTIQWKISDRGPAGKGVAAASVARCTHSCTACSATTVADTNGQTHSTMVTAAACGQMLCCK